MELSTFFMKFAMSLIELLRFFLFLYLYETVRGISLVLRTDFWFIYSETWITRTAGDRQKQF